ncbi:helix-turn-helix domain-containing protein [uncultured Muribaculum sp.]|uniref:helix-turn-helix transcriptional regulator n=1 Tax=uncultured Muribaculum sp. TaxID=1918613 RepID=UPI00261DF5D1|nr:helix-turn-helix domain-containing protein [uncultured Muribaculum sp.]
METSTPTFDQLPHVVSGFSEKLDRVLDILEKLGIANPIKNVKPSRRLVYAKEACQIIGKSLSTLYRAVKAPKDPIPSYKRGKLLYFYEDEIYAWIESGRKHSATPSLAETAAAITAGMKCRPRGGYNF